MAVPQLLEEDVRLLDGVLVSLVAECDAIAALLVDCGGFLITQAGETGPFDTVSMAALAAGTFAANQSIAALVSDTHFNCVYQQGDHCSVLVHSVDEHCLLVIIFKASTSVGLVKYCAAAAIRKSAEQMKIARERNPTTIVDFSALNLEDTSQFFRRKEAAAG